MGDDDVMDGTGRDGFRRAAAEQAGAGARGVGAGVARACCLISALYLPRRISVPPPPRHYDAATGVAGDES